MLSRIYLTDLQRTIIQGAYVSSLHFITASDMCFSTFVGIFLEWSYTQKCLYCKRLWFDGLEIDMRYACKSIVGPDVIS